MDTPNPSPLNQNSCLAHFWSFGSGTKNCAKIGQEGRYGHFWYEITCSWIFCNGHTQAIPFDPKLLFSAFLACFWCFGSGTEKLCGNRPGWPLRQLWVRKNLQLKFSQRSHPIHWVWPKTHIYRLFGVSVLVQKTVRKSARRAVLATFGTKKHAVEFFASDAPHPSALTQNSCLAHFWSFGSGMKNCAKNGSEGRSGPFGYERTCSWIIHNGRTQSIPFDPKLKFSVFFEFRYRYEKLCEKRPGGPLWTLLVQKTCSWIFHNRPTQTISFDSKLMFSAFSGVSVSVPKTVQKATGRAAMDTFGTKKLAVDFFAMDAPYPCRLT